MFTWFWSSSHYKLLTHLLSLVVEYVGGCPRCSCFASAWSLISTYFYQKNYEEAVPATIHDPLRQPLPSEMHPTPWKWHNFGDTLHCWVGFPAINSSNGLLEAMGWRSANAREDGVDAGQAKERCEMMKHRFSKASFVRCPALLTSPFLNPNVAHFSTQQPEE